MTTTLILNKFQSLVSKNKIKNVEIDRSVFGQRIGVFTKLFGCWHTNISRPFVQGKTTYRSCLQCGARKQFNPKTLETHGSFYFPPSVKKQGN